MGREDLGFARADKDVPGFYDGSNVLLKLVVGFDPTIIIIISLV